MFIRVLSSIQKFSALLVFSGGFLCSAALVGCASAPTKYENVNAAQWKAKALIKDNEQSRSYIVNLNFNVKKNEAARMDVTTTLGMGVASLLVTDKEVRYILFDSKRFYFGQPQPGVMRPILAIPFDPRWLQNVLFDIPIPEKSWTCSKDSDGTLKECQDSVSGVKITWSGHNGVKKTILIEHSKASVQINIQNFKAKVEDRKNLFSLEAPEGYQKLRVR
ncbi:MAG: hypothetical protein ACXVA9_03620 [Bdellovibrionales bacterium]